MRWAGRVACWVEGRVAYMVLVGKLEGHKPLGKLDVDGKIILKRSLCEISWGSWPGLICMRIGTNSELY